MIASLHESIESIKKYDFSGQWGTDIYLDPEAQKVYTFVNTNCIPATVYHGIDQRILSVYPTAIAESVHEYLSSIEENLESLLAEYQGTEWNGSNHVGQWTQAGKDLMEYLSQRQPEIASYWEASDWFEPVIGDLKQKWESGMTAEEIIDSEHLGNLNDGICDRTQAVEWLSSQIEEWKTEDSDEVL